MISLWPKPKVEPIAEAKPRLLGVHPNDHVQVVLHQSAECPLHVGGVYRVASTNGGRLQFRQCGRDHDPDRFKKVPYPSEPLFPEHARVRVRPGAEITDHECKLNLNRVYHVGSVDDFNRLFFYHQGCNHWHDPQYFIEEV